MPGTVKKLYRGQPTAGAGGDLAYTVPPAQKTLIKEILVVNTGTTPSDAEVHVAATAGTAITAATMLLPAPQFPPKSVTSIPMNLVIEAGEVIRVRQTNATACNVLISGVENAP